MSLKYESELLYDLMKRDGDDAPSDVLPYESELKEKYLNQVVGAYPKLQDYRPEWLNYNLYHHLPSDFPVETVADVTHATFQNVVPYAYGKAVLKGQTLVNEALIDYMNTANYATISGDTLTLDLSREHSLIELTKENPLLVPNAIYTCILYNVVGDTTNVNFSIQNASSTKLHLKDVGYKFKFTMGIGNNLTNRLCYVENLVATSGTVSFKMVLLKGDYTNVDIPYFTGMQSVRMPVLTTSNEDGTKSNILTVNEDVELGSVGEVKDELNLLTGELTQRIKENVLDGGEGWSYHPTWSSGDYLASYTRSFTDKSVGINNVLTNRFIVGKYITNNVPTSEFIAGENGNSVIYVCIKKDRLLNEPSDNIDDYRQAFLTYLNQNPIPIQYQLATESIKTVDLTCLNEQGESVNFMPFEGTMHVSTSSNTLPPLMDMDVPVEATTQNLNSFANMIKEE